MESVENLLKLSLDEIDKLLSAKAVVGEPIKVGDVTIIPLLSFGFGFGAGGTEASKGGSGAGAGVKPVAVIIIDGEGNTRVEPIAGAMGDAVGKIANTLGNVVNKVVDHKVANSTASQEEKKK